MPYTIVSRIESTDFNFFKILVELWQHLADKESAPRFFSNLWGLHRVNISPTGDGILYQSPQITKFNWIFRLSHRKVSLCVFSLRAKWVKSCLTQEILEQHEINLRSFLSILDRMQCAKKPSHSTVPLRRDTLRLWRVQSWVWSTPSDTPDSSLGRYVFGSEISYNKAPPRLPGLGC